MSESNRPKRKAAMLVGKQVADMITISRALVAFWLTWLGISKGETGLVMAVWTMILNWTGDALDGTFARRSSKQYHTWIGDHDLEVDILVSIGLLFYMLGAGLVGLRVVILFCLIWLLIVWHWGYNRSLGMLIQAPIFGWFIWIALYKNPSAGIWPIIWMFTAIVITWPRFPNEVVPGFLTGMKEVVNLRRK
jgi:hypothetical protein